MPRHRRAHDAQSDEAYGFHDFAPERPSSNVSKVGAAPHPPAGTFSPYSDGEKGTTATLATPSPVLHGERVRVRGSAGRGWKSA
ncbi:MAG: hypothetical protein EOQ30_24535 [Mesorhizobium sp.]|nr:MAG: hypothetical protein EOQ29_15475 [Mesorhizobium sp.]RWA80047.1 MAG: hypothetical protein EOQ30_24535 [Mesorhizobium sp.]